LRPLNDDHLAARQSFQNHDRAALGGPELQPFDNGLAVFDREHIGAKLIGDQGGLRNCDALFRFAALDGDLDKLAIDKFTIRIGDPGAHRHRVGRAVDLDVDKIDLSFLAICRAV